MPLDFVPMTRRVMVDGQEKAAALATLTKVVFDEKTGKSLDTLLSEMGGGSCGGFTLEKLWENPKPSEAFAAQDISLDCTGFSFFIMQTRYRSVNAISYSYVCFPGANMISSTVINTGDDKFYAVNRKVTFDTDKVSVGLAVAGFQGSCIDTPDNMIPVSIYGVKTSPAFGTGSAITWDDIYPVGSYYYSGDAEFDPNTAFGGTWEKVAENLALRQASTGHAVGSAFGEAEHVLTADEMPEKAYYYTVAAPTSSGQFGNGRNCAVGTNGNQNGSGTGAALTKYNLDTGRTSGQEQAPIDICGPSLAVNIWHKTANGGKVVGQNKGGFSYSTEEQWTGEYWIDGKKIYRKVLAGNENGATSANISIEGVDTMIEMSGLISDSADTNPGLPINAYGNSNLYAFTFFSRGSNRITMSVNGWKIYKYNLLVKYTKATE